MRTLRRSRSRILVTALLSALLAATLLGGAGCWFTKGKEGYVCKDSDDCNDGLRCRAYSAKGQIRKQCRPRNARSISSKSGYTDFAIYLSYGFWIALPFVIGGLVIRQRMIAKKGGGQPPAPGAPPAGGDAPPPAA